MEKQKVKKAAVISGTVIILTIVVIVCILVVLQEGKNSREINGAEISSKDAVLALEREDSGKKIPAGDRENMTRLAIVRGGKLVFEMKKEPSENQTDFQEWYITVPYSYKQLVNVSGLYDFLEHYAVWDCLGEVGDVDFKESGIYVEEGFEDTGSLRIEIGQQNSKGNYYVRADYSGRVYEVEKKQVEVMTGLKPQDFMMGIASLVYLTTVERLEIQTENVEAVFNIETASDNSQIYKKGDNVCEEKGFKEMYASLLAVTITGEAGEIKDLGKPALHIHFFRNTQQLEDVEINYYPYDKTHYLIERNGEKQFLAEKEAVDYAISVITKFCS